MQEIIESSGDLYIVFPVTAFNSTLNFYFCIDICVGHCMSSPLQCYLRKKGFSGTEAWVLQASSLSSDFQCPNWSVNWEA